METPCGDDTLAIGQQQISLLCSALPCSAVDPIPLPPSLDSAQMGLKLFVCVCLSVPAGLVCLAGGQLQSTVWCMTFRKGQQEDLLFRLQEWGLTSLPVCDKHVTGNIYVTSKKGFFCNSRFSANTHD